MFDGIPDDDIMGPIFLINFAPFGEAILPKPSTIWYNNTTKAPFFSETAILWELLRYATKGQKVSMAQKA